MDSYERTSPNDIFLGWLELALSTEEFELTQTSPITYLQKVYSDIYIWGPQAPLWETFLLEIEKLLTKIRSYEEMHSFLDSFGEAVGSLSIFIRNPKVLNQVNNEGIRERNYSFTSPLFNRLGEHAIWKSKTFWAEEAPDAPFLDKNDFCSYLLFASDLIVFHDLFKIEPTNHKYYEKFNQFCIKYNLMPEYARIIR